MHGHTILKKKSRLTFPVSVVGTRASTELGSQVHFVLQASYALLSMLK
jgi:hypothetical protein